VSVLALAREIAESVPDPELPMLTLADLGILREVSADGDRVIVSLTPTYSGCPALAEMRRDLSRRLAAAGLDAEVRTALSPAWSSDWITAAGRRKLSAAGIAPPLPAPPRGGPVPLNLTPVRRDVACPLCGASGASSLFRDVGADPARVMRAGDTACGCDPRDPAPDGIPDLV